MKANGSITSKMINRNWVLKRKRRKLPHGIDTSSGRENTAKPSETNGSSKRRVKSESTLVRAPGKKKGNDGYYYECMVCDLGGSLLCCENCPRTYHIQCLDPPLKRIPMGTWLCPNCSSKSGSLGDIEHLEPNSKRARSNIVIGKTKNGNKSSSSDKGSRVAGNSSLEKKQSLGKGKASIDHQAKIAENKLDSPSVDVSLSSRPAHSSQGGSIEGCSSDINVNNENRPELSSIDAPEDKKLVSSDREVLSPSRGEDLHRKEESCDIMPDLPCNNKSPTDKLAPLSNVAARSARKRKHKVHFEGAEKKLRSDKGEYSGSNSRKCGSKSSANRGANNSHRKCKIIQAGSSSIPKEDTAIENIEISLKEEILPAEGALMSEGLHDVGNVVVESLACENHITGEVQQVDRVLGCRVQHDKISSTCQISPMNASELPSQTSDISGSQTRLPKEIQCHKSTSDQLTVEALTRESQNIMSQSEEGKYIKSDVKVDKMQVYRRSMTKKCRDGNVMELTKRYKGSSSSSAEGKFESDSAMTTEDKVKTANNISTRESSDVCLGSCNNVEVSEIIEIPSSPRIEELAVMDSGKGSSPEKNVEESLLTEPTSSDIAPVTYEFFVKWVGKSHIHNSWVPESHLKVLAKRKLDNYKAKYGTAIINICEERWKLPQRVIGLRDSVSGSTDVFVKWTGLPYEECTWESIDGPVIAKFSHLIDLYKHFEHQTVERDNSKEQTAKSMGDAHHSELATLTEQPKELQGGSLFAHQLEALNWLRKCWYKSKNVILADEMGLGKTVSACAFISSLYFEFKVKLPCLVLVPLSTMPNWMSEFALWAPNINVVEYHGCAKARALIRQYEWHSSDPSEPNKRTTSYKFNVLLTTYEMVLVDSAHLRGIPWEVLVVDEGHRLKNSSSKLFSMLNTFSFQHRVLLTGTPLQNNIGEMYNLLNFLQPASFPSLSSFEEKFNDLTTAEKVEELKKLVAPHMLRRLKKDAMQNIPPKTERMVPVELSSIQAEYYRAMLTKNYQILRNIGRGVPQQSMLNIVMQLRKVCNHPYLIPGTEPDSGSIEFLHEMRIKASAKLTLLHSMLKILYKEDRKVLIFSQMTKLLDILEDYLTIEFGPKTFERVDGSVSVADRQTAIARFNQDRSRFVFLLSTRSCGLGINLATADTVIIYDSDFNPHADIQAMNRAHRIGQSNRLLVYRLVVRASVEERILQLAKKKLMLDQLFVNKSGSQKEVEDILRWGTEELFGDSISMSDKDGGEEQRNSIETVAEIEHKHKRRAGGLGDVYKDICAEGRNKIVWDENAILKLLDRSNLQTGSPDNAEGDLENDMLGSVKSVDWNEETTEEQGGIEAVPAMTVDISTSNSGRKEESVVSVTEENEWDRLLRVRWEQYQTEEEAALGRGKRQRKAVSYREAYASHPSEAMSEQSGDEENPEPELEPERDYTPAGKALKEKYTKLRARQKARLAQRNVIEASQAVNGLPKSLPLVQILVSSVPDETPMAQQPIEERAPVIDLEDGICAEVPEASKSKANLASKLEKILRQKPWPNLDLTAKPIDSHTLDVNLPSQHLSDSGYTNLVPNNNLLPVLGLCAPNANRMESSQKNFPRSHSRQSKQVTGPDFPFHVASSSGSLKEMNVKGPETVADKFKQPDVLLEGSQQRPSSGIPENHFPFCLQYAPIPQVNGSNPADRQTETYADFQEKMALPKLPLDDTLMPRYPFPTRNMVPAQPDLFPSLSMGFRNDLNDTIRDLPTMPLLPNLKFVKEHASKYNQQEREVPLMLGLGPNPPSFSSFPENHRKVLENIMMRTGSTSNSLFRKKAKMDFWTENELDYLWIGVRRHGRGNWEPMLRDPRLKFSKFKTAEDLSVRWEEEQLKLLEGPSFPVPNSYFPMKSHRPTLFPDIPDEMMARALNGSKFSGPSKFQSHLTDMKLGLGDVSPALPHLKPSDQFNFHTEHVSPMHNWNVDRLRTNLPGDSSAGPSDRPGTSANVLADPPFQLSSLGSNLDPLGLFGSRNLGPSHKEGEKGVGKFGNLPSFIDKSPVFLRDSRNNMVSDGCTVSALPDDSMKGWHLSMKGKDDAGESSSANNKLPHWLREAVNAPAKPLEPDLPPTISAIAHSVRLVYGEDNSTIPPFVPPCPLSAPPKGPQWCSRRKKRKSRVHRQFPVDNAVAGGNQNLESCNDEEGVIPVPASLPPPLVTACSTAVSSGLPSGQTNANISALNLNVTDVSVPSVYPESNEKMSILSPSPEVFQLVASCKASSAAIPDVINPSFLESQVPHKDQGRFPETGDAFGKQKSEQSPPPLCAWGSQSRIEVLDQSESEDSSKTQSDPTRPKQPEEEDISSEGTVSDHRTGNHEPSL